MITDAMLDALNPDELRSLAGRVWSRISKGNRFGEKPDALSAMVVGQVVTLNRALCHYDRVRARKRLNDPQAQWTSERLANGTTRIKRIR